ncbi:MAG: hypothetical protein M3O01_13815 [Pseudomonadota bacterium]|nr:hypothetical protein [Pseudomonadota bacterium]
MNTKTAPAKTPTPTASGTARPGSAVSPETVGAEDESPENARRGTGDGSPGGGRAAKKKPAPRHAKK